MEVGKGFSGWLLGLFFAPGRASCFPNRLFSSGSEVNSAKDNSIFSRLSFWLYLLAVILAPIPDGSVGPLWIQIWVLVFSAAVLVGSHRDVTLGSVIIMWCVAFLMAMYILVALLQSISPGPNPLPLWFEASQLIGADLIPISSSVRNSPIFFLGRPLLAALVFVGGLLFSGNDRRCKLLIHAVVISACLYSAIGFIGLIGDMKGLRPFDQGGSLTTFFLNKNTSATYIGSAFLLVFALVIQPTRDVNREREEALSVFEAAWWRSNGKELGAGIFLLAMLPLTLSRAGVMLTLSIAIGCLIVKNKLRDVSSIWKITLGLAVLFSLIFALTGESWHERNSRLGFDTLGRLDAYREMMSAARQHPLLGLGLGSFTQSFPQYRTEELGLYGTFNIGHSTPIELIFEGGYPLAVLVIVAAIGCCGVLLVGTYRRPNDPWILGALLVGLLGGVHSSLDFSLQIPGYMINYLAVVGVGVGRSFLPRSKGRLVKKRFSRSAHGSA